MGAGYRALAVALPLAAFAAGCQLWPGRDAETEAVASGSVTAGSPEQTTPAPSLAAFEATEVTTGLTCTGNYSPLENSPTFSARVVCRDGRSGTVTGPRTNDLGGTGTLELSDGGGGAVTLRRLTAAETEAPPAATNQLPAPDPSTYLR